jgi:Ca2+-binding EF-hand superfamily protein
METVQERLGRPFVDDVDLRSNLENIQLYLAKQDPTHISLKKLRQAMLIKSEEPLKQDLIEEQVKYIDDVKGQITDAQRKKTADTLVKYLREKGYGFTDLLPQFSKSTEMPRAAFRDRLKHVKFTCPDEEMQDLMKVLATPDGKAVDIKPLKKKMAEKGGAAGSAPNVAGRLGIAPAVVRDCLEILQRHLSKEKTDADEFFAFLDKDNSGDISRAEFVNGIDNMRMPGVKKQALKDLFDFMDMDESDDLSRYEFANYIKGAEKTNDEKIRALPAELRQQITQNINTLFDEMDEDRSNSLDAGELYIAYSNMGMSRDRKEVEDMIYQTTNGKTVLSREEFTKMMEPVLFEQYLTNIQNEEDLRRIFREADADYSGFLDVVELAEAIKRMGATITPDEVANLMSEADHDRNMQLDIEEFVTFFTMGGDILKDEQNKKKFSEITLARQLSPADFFKAFKGMPQNFVQSFTSKLLDNRRCLPSSVFKAQVDPRTMLWKDIYNPREYDLKGLNLTAEQQPYIRPIQTKVGAMISLVEAAGIVTQNSAKGGNDILSNIKLRAVRASLMIRPSKKSKVAEACNTVQCPAFYDKTNSDIWSLEDSRNPGAHLSNILFRCIDMEYEALERQNASIVFEMVIAVPKPGGDDSMNEMTVGWAELPLSQLDQAQTLRLEVKGGSPAGVTDIKSEDVKAERSGYRYFTQMVAGNGSGLTVRVEPYTRLADEQKFHMDLMPGTCLLHAELLQFCSAFMNYKGKHCLSTEYGSMAFKKPPGDVIISTFPMLLDNPDICEFMALCWKEDVAPKLSGYNSKNIRQMVDEMKDFVTRLYPVLYSVDIRSQIDFKGGIHVSVRGDSKKFDDRKKLVNAALRFKKDGAKQKENTAPSEMAEFTPFNIREFEFDVWDTSEAKRAEFKQRHMA